MYGKTMKKLRSRINVRLVSNKKDFFYWTSKPSHMSQKILANDLVAVFQSKVILTLRKPEYAWMYKLDLSKVIVYESHCDYIKKINIVATQDSYSLTLTLALMYQIKANNIIIPGRW